MGKCAMCPYSNLIYQVGCESLVEPQVVPPLESHQVAEPLICIQIFFVHFFNKIWEI